MSELNYFEWAEDENTRCPDELLEEAERNYEENDVSIVTQIAEEMSDDGDDETDRLFMMYRNSDDHEKAVIDATLIHVCGWSLKSLIKLTKGENP